MTARELAIRSFWSERPLVRLFAERTRRTTFSLRELIAFAEALPSAIVASLWAATFEGGGGWLTGLILRSAR